MIGIDLYTIHEHPAGLCNDTAGIYYVHESGAAGGLLKNSECRLGAWAGYSWETNTLDVLGAKASAGLIVGAIAGYRAHPIIPLALPSVKVDRYRVTWLPRAPGAQSGGLHFSAEFNF